MPRQPPVIRRHGEEFQHPIGTVDHLQDNKKGIGAESEDRARTSQRILTQSSSSGETHWGCIWHTIVIFYLLPSYLIAYPPGRQMRRTPGLNRPSGQETRIGIPIPVVAPGIRDGTDNTKIVCVEREKLPCSWPVEEDGWEEPTIVSTISVLQR